MWTLYITLILKLVINSSYLLQENKYEKIQQINKKPYQEHVYTCLCQEDISTIFHVRINWWQFLYLAWLRGSSQFYVFFAFGMESQHFQEKVVRIRIKQSIWHCRAGIDSGLGRQDLHVFVGVGEVVSWQWSWVLQVECHKQHGRRSYCLLPTDIPTHTLLFSPSTQVWPRSSKKNTTYMLQRTLPGESAAPAHSPLQNCIRSNKLSMKVDYPKNLPASKVSLFHRHLPFQHSLNTLKDIKAQ